LGLIHKTSKKKKNKEAQCSEKNPKEYFIFHLKKQRHIFVNKPLIIFFFIQNFIFLQVTMTGKNQKENKGDEVLIT
jgi:hypothetical protein